MEPITEHLHYAQSLWENGHTHDRIILELHKRGLQHERMEEVTQHLKKLRYAKRRSRGINMLAAGCACLLLGFVFSLMLSNSGSLYQYSLYGLTTLGTIILVAGMADVLG